MISSSFLYKPANCKFYIFYSATALYISSKGVTRWKWLWNLCMH